MFNDILNIINSRDPASYEQARLILDNNPDLVNTIDHRGNTLLHYAAIDNVEIAGFLLDRGACVNVRGHRGNTPLHYAAEEGNLQVARLLLDRGAHVNIKDHSSHVNRFPLLIAARRLDYNFTKLLLERGADVITEKSDDFYRTIAFVNDHSINQLLIKYALIQDSLARYPFNEPDLSTYDHYDELHGDEQTRRINEALNLCNEEIRNNELVFGSQCRAYWDQCKAELELIKSFNIGSVKNQNISLYDFCTADETQLILYMKQQNIFNKLNSDQLRNSFPIFAEIFSSKFEEGNELLAPYSNILYDQIRDRITINLKSADEKRLPPEIVSKISGSLDYHGRRNLLEVSMTTKQESSWYLEKHDEINEDIKKKTISPQAPLEGTSQSFIRQQPCSSRAINSLQQQTQPSSEILSETSPLLPATQQRRSVGTSLSEITSVLCCCVKPHART